MQNFYGIVARDIHKCIGEKGSNFIPFSSSVDMKHFKKITDNKNIIVGNNTFKSIISKNPKFYMSKYHVYVLSSKPYFNFNNVSYISDINELYEIKTVSDFYVIGGASIYQQFHKIISKVYITEFDTTFNCDNPVYCDWTFEQILSISTVIDNNIKLTFIEGFLKK